MYKWQKKHLQDVKTTRSSNLLAMARGVTRLEKSQIGWNPLIITETNVESPLGGWGGRTGVGTKLDHKYRG